MSQGLPKQLKLKVYTPLSLLIDEDVLEVVLPGLEGSRGILPGHRKSLIALGRGVLSYRLGSQEEKFAIKGGYAEILPERVVVFTEQVERESIGFDSGG